jgi:hypothetical protein
MSQEINYKSKYKELKLKFMNSVDIAFRLGFEAGAQQAQKQQAQDMQAQASQNGMEMGQPPNHEEPTSAENAPTEQNGSELDEHINKLESMLGSDSNPEIQKSLTAILSLRKEEKLATEMKKSQDAIKGISKVLHKPAFKFGVQASHNLSDNAKKAVSMQHKIVNDVMKSWSTEEAKVKNSLENILSVEGLLKE